MPAADLRGYSAEERTVLFMARERGEFARRDVEQLLSCGPTKAKAVVGALLKKRAIAPKGGGRSTRYVISEG